MKNNYLYAIILISCCSCGITEEDIISELYAPENGLYHRAAFSEESYAILYQPSALVAQSEIRESHESASRIKKKYEQLDYFLLEINKGGDTKEKEEDFYYSYLLEKDIYQTEGRDTIRPSLFQLEPNLWGSKKMRMNLAFPKRDSDRSITIADRYGESVNFHIDQRDIARSSQKANRL